MFIYIYVCIWYVYIVEPVNNSYINRCMPVRLLYVERRLRLPK